MVEKLDEVGGSIDQYFQDQKSLNHAFKCGGVTMINQS